MFRFLTSRLAQVPLIQQIAVGLVLGIGLAVFFPAAIPAVKIFGDLFVKALKGIAPLLVFFLVINAMAQRKDDAGSSMKPIIGLYVAGTFLASLVGVTMSFLFPTRLVLQVAPDTKLAPPGGIVQVLHNLVLSLVDNPVTALMNANYIGILAWAVILGIAFKSCAGDAMKGCLADVAKVVTKVVTWVIHFAPLGILGLVADSVGTSGVSALVGYLHLLGARKEALPLLGETALPLSHSLARLARENETCAQMAAAQSRASDLGALCRTKPEPMGGIYRQKIIFLTN